jgi:hypothetical protein
VIAATIANLPGRLAAEPATGPVIVMIGTVFADYLEQATRDPTSINEISQTRVAR